MAELIISLNNQVIKKLKLTAANYLIGRANNCDIVLNERTVSAEHAHLVSLGDDCFLEDMKSTNGVYVNKVRTHRHLLLDQDLVQIGKYELLFQSPFNPYQQLYKLSLKPSDLEQPTEFARLEIMKGEKTGYLIPLKNKHVNLSTEASRGETVTIEADEGGRYFLHTLDKEQVKTFYQLHGNDSFMIGEIELKFHLGSKLVKL